MQHGEARHDFASDNTAGICPEALQALVDASAGAAASYGFDECTAKLCDRVRDLFETDCDVYLVFNGTAANALLLAQLCQSFHSVVCYQNAHIQTDECGAPEFFTNGSKLLTIGGPNGKMDLTAAAELVARQVDLHSHKPRVISLTQSTEFGTVYSIEGVAAVTEFARSRDMLVHMDGARFANAVASLGCFPKEITWKLGVDVLSFGGTKNGLAAGELVIFFDKGRGREFEYRAKQAGQLASKMRFLAAPWHALLQDEVWLRNARHANVAAKRFAKALLEEVQLEIAFPVEANALFVRMRQEQYEELRGKGWRFSQFFETDLYRLMCSWSTTNEKIDRFVNDARALRAA